MDESGSGQYGQPPPLAPSADAMRRVQGPAIALIIVAGLGIFLHIASTLARLLGITLLGAAGAGREDFAWLHMLAGTVGLMIALLGSIVGIVIIVGGVRMKALKSYGLAMTATILAMIPCISPCCLLGLPVGIWSLVVLLDENVKASFRS